VSFVKPVGDSFVFSWKQVAVYVHRDRDRAVSQVPFDLLWVRPFGDHKGSRRVPEVVDSQA